ncbi:hypothetical protein EV198_2090 [Roseivirga ehrenbergii]|uniref:DUF4382 domain-containing protein n=1 Tax=Roseivirga ehrenbergii (strain DSM 102268 / JCM 13514 / KCTC 12282 / NCIMB 14502 / KMM 6017) TaxID=279360 RepID=A0A150WYV2_ROSEK|nr:hypothetical protein [Roseivirga ehrenbergii]KYG71654.1 hypothetical protein MB14_10060 [Roseivirga ehrenbergii]TCL07657.1 hypothetical protein EV198_2090 [Roseivirga ehrenbergii]
MKKNVLLILLMATIISACGEAGIQSDISQVVETDPVTVTLDVPAVAVGQLINETPPVTVETGEINITSDEFDEYMDELQRFTINKIWYKVEGFNAGNEADLDVTLNIISGGSSTELLETTIVDAHLQTDDVLLFDKAAPGDVNPAAVSVIESALLNGTSFKIELVLVGRNVTFQTTSDTFDFLFKFDVTARVQLD